MKRLLSLLIVLALVITFMAMSTGVASADAPEMDKMLMIKRPGDLGGIHTTLMLPLTTQDGAETAAAHSPALVYAGP